jgi:hypothetical protein
LNYPDFYPESRYSGRLSAFKQGLAVRASAWLLGFTALAERWRQAAKYQFKECFRISGFVFGIKCMNSASKSLPRLA